MGVVTCPPAKAPSGATLFLLVLLLVLVLELAEEEDALLQGLSPGAHTIHFAGTINGGAWGLDVTYNLTVPP